MRLLVVSDFVYPNYVGGVPRHVRDIMQEYLRRGIDVNLVTRTSAGSYKSENPDSFYSDLVESARVIELAGVKIFLFGSYKKLVSECDIINVHHPVVGLVAGIVSFFYRKQLFYNFHGPYHCEYQQKVGKKNISYIFCYWMQWLLLQLANKILVHSDYMAGLVEGMSRSCKSKIVYLPPYVDINKFKLAPGCVKKSLRRKWGLDDDALVVFTSRRLTKRTGVLELVKQWPFVLAKLQKRAVLIIAGAGELRGEIASFVAGDQTVKMVGCVPDSDLVEFYQLSDVYLLPSLDLEGFGLVILEALSCGLPVCVSTRAGGGADFVKREMGSELLFDLFNPADICRSIKFAVDKYGNEDPSNILRTISLKYSLDNLADSYLKIFAM